MTFPVVICAETSTAEIARARAPTARMPRLFSAFIHVLPSPQPSCAGNRYFPRSPPFLPGEPDNEYVYTAAFYLREPLKSNRDGSLSARTIARRCHLRETASDNRLLDPWEPIASSSLCASSSSTCPGIRI